MAKTPRPILDRLLEKAMPEPNSGCWLWLGNTHRQGYGKLSYYCPEKKKRTGGKHGSISIYAHRLSFELHNGPIPPGMLVRHTCDNPSCINPFHLIIGTDKDNHADAIARGRHAVQKPRTLRGTFMRTRLGLD